MIEKIHPGPEQDIEELKLRVEKQGEQGAKEEIKKYIEETQKAPSFSPPVATRDEAKEIKKFQTPGQVGALISLVFQKGLKQAVAVASELDNPAVLDEFHDTLVDRYYQELVKRGILKY